MLLIFYHCNLYSGTLHRMPHAALKHMKTMKKKRPNTAIGEMKNNLYWVSNIHIGFITILVSSQKSAENRMLIHLDSHANIFSLKEIVLMS